MLPQKAQNNANTNLAIINFSNQMDALERFLPNLLNDEKELWDWWNKLSDVWHDIFYVNWRFSKDFTLSENLKFITFQGKEARGSFYKRYKERFPNYKVQITTDVLKEIVQLEALGCSGNKLENCAPLAKLQNLKYLDLSLNRINNLSPLSEMKNLVKLDVNNNHELVVEPNFWQKLPRLNILWISNTKISQKTLFHVKELTTLVLSGKQIGFLDIYYCENLSTLLVNGKITDKVFFSKRYENLRNIYFSYYNDNLLFDDFRRRNRHINISSGSLLKLNWNF